MTSYTIKLDDCYRYYGYDEDLDGEFQSASDDISHLQNTMRHLNPMQDQAFAKCLADDLITVIFGSNQIEKVGASLDITTKLCERIFQGADLEVEARIGDYANQLKDLIGSMDSEASVKTREAKEVIQHAKVLQHITTSLITHNEPLTETLWLETHKTLCEGLPLDDGGPQVEYAGTYRTQEVTAGFSAFSNPFPIPTDMSTLIKDFNRDIDKAERAQELDQFFLAAKFCYKFVMIHPFLYGDVRVSRLLLNAILLKYAGIVVPLGEEDGYRDKYLGIAAKAAEAHEEDETPGPTLLRSSL